MRHFYSDHIPKSPHNGEHIFRGAPGRNIPDHKCSVVEALRDSVFIREDSDLMRAYPVVSKHLLHSLEGRLFVELHDCVGGPAKQVLLDMDLLNIPVFKQQFLHVCFCEGSGDVHKGYCSGA